MGFGGQQRAAVAVAFAAVALVLAAVAFGTGVVDRGQSGSGGRSGEGSAAGGENGARLIDWPLFGRVPERTHYLADEARDLDPPLREAWSINTHALIEFPPAIADGVAYIANKYGNARAIRLRDHRVLWERVTDRKLSGPPTFVTAPVYHRGRVYLAFLDGDLVAVDADSGETAWKRNLHAHLESSPLAVGDNLYLGDDKTDLVSLRAADGKVRWQFNSPGAIKASPSYHGGRVCVADYQASMYCVDAGSGRVLWRTNTSKLPPFGDGGFYSSPAIAFGHVYAARDDGTVYAFDEKTGKVEWFFPTHDFIYGSPAVAHVPGTPPSVYIGSYDEHFYALDALSGKQRWRFDVGGAVPGTAAVIGHTAYTSSFKTRETIGIDVRNHRKTFSLREAGYTPVVSDGRHLYLVGYFELIGLKPARR
ncbi:MAG TPA: PQQ-binding-like beta-propeller repeat protein [Solirubrobacterales bacterium]|nr:PQQ-binding-like beta-propeller repeat protein [Solirubrobacterales bacterium]